MTLLSVRSLSIYHGSGDDRATLVDNMNLSIAPGETLGIVGESGSGKSLSSLAIMGLLDKRSGFTIEGRIELDGQCILGLSPRKLRSIRGKRIAMIFQDPLTSLNPVQRVEKQLIWPMRHHLGLPTGAARERAAELLDRVGIPNPGARLSDYPHQFSGGMRQRLMIAIALSCNPDVLIADEPTTALDVTMQAQVIELLRSLQKDTGMGMIFITHDLGVVANFTDRITVVYAGRAVETGPATELIRAPRMPYSRRLLAAIPRADVPPKPLEFIAGTLPPVGPRIEGCLFAPRCRIAEPVCHRQTPLLEDVTPGHAAACFFSDTMPRAGTGE